MDEKSLRATPPSRGYVPWVITAAAVLALAVVALARSGASEPAASVDGVFGVTRSSGDAVMVDLTPKRSTDGRLHVSITVTTHTVDDLDKYDLKEVSRLVVGGARVAPLSAPGLEGHHNTGELIFPLDGMPTSFSVEIRGLDGPDVRTFAWP